MERIGWVSIISGGGTTMDAMAEQVTAGLIATDERKLEARKVIATNPKAGGIEKAEKRGISVEVVNPRDFTKPDGTLDHEAFDRRMVAVLYDAGADITTMNGCLIRMREQTIAAMTPPQDEFDPETGEIRTGKLTRVITNQHPGALPATAELFAKQPHHAMLLYRRLSGTEPTSEVVSHIVVSDKYDEGPIIGAASFPIRRLDSPDDMQKRALPLEHGVQIGVLWDFVRGTIKPAQTLDLTMNEEEQQIVATARKMAKLTYPKA